MGICCSKKVPSSVKQIHEKPNLDHKIVKNPEEKTLFKEKPIVKHRKSSETEGRFDKKSLQAIQKNPNTKPRIEKNPDEKTGIEANPIIKQGRRNKTERPFDREIEKNPNPDPQVDKHPDEKTENKEKPFIKHRKSNEIERKLDKEIPKPEQKPISLATNSPEESNLITNGDEVDAILIQCGRLSRCSSAAQTPSSGHQEAENLDMATTRESRRQSRPSPNRKRTPSRERGEKERDNQRRVSRSPGKRSEMACRDPTSRPGKMMSVPATDKEAPIKRGGVASPRRSRSPVTRANSRVSSDNNQNSRKAEKSPYRRNPLSEIDQNAVTNSLSQKQNLDSAKNSRTKMKQPTQAEEQAKALPQTTTKNAPNVVTSGPEPLKQQALTRTRSSRLSRDLDNLNLNLTLDAQNPTPPSSYTALLLEDIQNFHNKNPLPISLPQCLSKTCSILDQIADLNSNKGTEGLTMEKYAKKMLENKEPPLLETEVVGMNDLVEPSFQKYVTVNRADVKREEGEESSGSNSFAGAPQHWIPSSLWETYSTDSNDCRSNTRNSRLNTKEDDSKKREIDCHKMGIGKGRADLSRGRHLRSAISTATI